MRRTTGWMGVAAVLWMSFTCVAGAVTIRESFSSDPRERGWRLVDSSGGSAQWNPDGWVEIRAARQPERAGLFIHLDEQLDPDRPFWFSMDVAVSAGESEDWILRGLFADPSDPASASLSAVMARQDAMVVPPDGGRARWGQGTLVASPYLARLRGRYEPDGRQGGRFVVTVHCLQGGTLLSESEVRVDSRNVDLSQLRWFGIANRGDAATGAQGSASYDHLYFSTQGPDEWSRRPDFAEQRVAEQILVQPFAGGDHVRIDLTLRGQGRGLSYERIEAWIVEADGETAVLWEGGWAEPGELERGRDGTVSFTVEHLQPRRWSPETPNLYRLHVRLYQKDGTTDLQPQRFGFRTVESRGGQILINGKPYFLRGNAINPPARGISDEVALTREFAEAYLRDLQAHGVNTIRTGRGEVPASQEIWLDVADEMGFLVFEGRYGYPFGGTRNEPPQCIDEGVRIYKERTFDHLVRHPSVIIFLLANEVNLQGERGEKFKAYYDAAYQRLSVWDPNRVFVESLGFGRGVVGDVLSLHTYVGWYNGSSLSYLNYRQPFSERSAGMPWIYTECVGAYTLHTGAFRSENKQLAAALRSAGRRMSGPDAPFEYQRRLAGESIEFIRRLRRFNPNLAGIMPFTFIYNYWHGIRQFEDMQGRPILDQYGVSYQPVLVSIECWTPHLYAGSVLRPIGHVVHDDTARDELPAGTLHWTLRNASGAAVAEARSPVASVPYYEVRSSEVEITVPAGIASGDGVLECVYEVDGEVLSSNRYAVVLAGADWREADGMGPRPLIVYEPEGGTTTWERLRRIGIEAEATSNPMGSLRDRPDAVLLVAPGVFEDLLRDQVFWLRPFVEGGGRIVFTAPHPESVSAFGLADRLQVLPIERPTGIPSPIRPWHDGDIWGTYVHLERPDHPVFRGIDPDWMIVWNDPDGWDETQPGMPHMASVSHRIELLDAEGLSHIANLANFERGLRYTALCEVTIGEGAILFTAFDFFPRVGADPVSDRVLANLLAYATQRDILSPVPQAGQTIRWGDFQSERAIITHYRQGFLVETEPTPVTPEGFGDSRQYVGSGDQQQPAARRLFGDYEFNRLCHIRDLAPERNDAEGVMFLRPPVSARRMVTLVQNKPLRKYPGGPAELRILVNGRQSASVEIPEGEQQWVSVDLPQNGKAVRLDWKGTKALILKESMFE